MNDDELESTIESLMSTSDQQQQQQEEEEEENAIQREFESYLNDDEDDDDVDYEDDDDDLMMIDGVDEVVAGGMTRRSKLASLSRVDYSIENVEQLRRLAVSRHGFVSKKFRRQAWPLLIMSRSADLADNTNSVDNLLRSSIEHFDRISSSQIQCHSYYNQVKLDVIRTLKRFPPEISDKLRSRLQDQLIDIICKVLIKAGGALHYYQGYHDICLTFLLVTGATECLPLIENITRSHLTPFMETTMETTVKILYNMMPLIDSINPSLAEHLQKAELGIIFGLSWLITWYSHVMENLKVILRLYDLFIASDPLMPVYLAAIIVTQRSGEVLSMDCDMATLHTVITKFPSAVEDSDLVEGYIEMAIKLFHDYPPNKLPELNETWLTKCKRIQDEMVAERENAVRQRRKNKHKNNKNGNNESDSDLEPSSSSKGKRKRFGKSRANNNKLVPAHNNRFLFGLTLTAGVMAVAMLAMNPSVVKEPHDLISKFYHLFNY